MHVQRAILVLSTCIHDAFDQLGFDHEHKKMYWYKIAQLLYNNGYRRDPKVIVGKMSKEYRADIIRRIVEMDA